MKRTLIALIAAVALPAMASAAVIYSDDFESYADTAEMQAMWGNTGAGSLATAFGNPGQSMEHPGGAGSVVTVPVQQATAASPLVYTADIYDDGTSANKRLTAGLRFSGVANLIEMGMYNSPNHYAVRVVLPGPSWVAFSNILDDAGTPIANAPVEGWHRYQVVLDGSSATFTLDLGSTGIINATEVVAATWNANGVDSIRLGGPSNLSSDGGGGFFDNVSLQVIPEPASALLLASVIGLASVRRSRG